MACVVASTPTQALPLLSNPITAVHQASLPPKEAKEIPDHALTYFDVLTYNYLGGILLAMLKKWRLAEEHFEICATAPTQSPYCASALQMEALKKLVLVQLIAYGKVWLAILSDRTYLDIIALLAIAGSQIHATGTLSYLQNHALCISCQDLPCSCCYHRKRSADLPIRWELGSSTASHG